MKPFSREFAVISLIFVLFYEVKASEYFTDEPPDDYLHRKTLQYCPIKFYYDPDQFVMLDAFGGSQAFSGEFPHMAAIGWTIDGQTHYLCGGTLITSNHVLTAAHCAVNEDNVKPDTVRLGDTYLFSEKDDEQAQQIKIRAFKKHPQYSHFKKYFDIALIELEKDATFNAAVCPGCLWLENSLPTEEMHAIGFGALGFAERVSPTLQKVILSAISTESCLQQLPLDKRHSPKGIVHEQFCAGSETMDTCEGDSGGPLQVERVDFQGNIIPLVVGIVSFGTPCTNGSLGVYTRVASYLKWIEDEVQSSMDYLTCSSRRTCSNARKIPHKLQEPPERPFHRVGLLWNQTDTDSYHCGATLIDYQYALTSAFCTQNKQGPPKFIIVESTGETVAIDEVTVHPDYALDRPEKDIALLRLSKYLVRNFEMLPACLWRKNVIQARYDEMFFSVYGPSSVSQENSSVDKKERKMIKISTIGNGECTNPAYKEKNLLCGNNTVNLVPTLCKIDYGGPVVTIDYVEFVPDLFGVISTQSKDCADNLVAVRVSDHVEWIESVVFNHLHDQLTFS